MSQLQNLQREIRALASPERAKASEWFFKTKEGEYGHGDAFLGLTVPVQRVLAKKYVSLSFDEIGILLHSGYHEERLIALLILVYNYLKAAETGRKAIFDFYIANTRYINNWDLVDTSADKIVGAYLFEFTNKNIDLLRTFARSAYVWERRIAMIATYHFIKNGSSEEAFTIADVLINDKHDLIHKAVGWMLREVGKRVSKEEEEKFLRKHYKIMPRTMLRYAIEHFPEEKRKKYLSGDV